MDYSDVYTIGLIRCIHYSNPHFLFFAIATATALAVTTVAVSLIFAGIGTPKINPKYFSRFQSISILSFFVKTVKGNFL